MPVVCPKNYGTCGVSTEYDPNRIFVLMPFSEAMAPQNLFFEVLQHLPGWDVQRADSDLSKPEIWCKICANIQSSRAVVADLSGSNPNVFLELGLSWGLGRPFILLTQDIKKLPFDTKSFHVIEYSRNDSQVIDSDNIRRSVLKALDALPVFAPLVEAESPEAYLNTRISDAKKRTVHLWYKSDNGWKVFSEIPSIQRIGISLLKDYPQSKSIDQISLETNAKKRTVQVYLSSKTHGYSDYFNVNQGIVRLSSSGVYWILDMVNKNF